VLSHDESPCGVTAMERSSPRQADPVLLPFLSAGDEVGTKRCLERLIGDAEPIIHGIIRRKWRLSPNGTQGQSQNPDAQIAEDVRGEVILQLLERLDALKAGRDKADIRSFRDFVAVTTYHVCDTYLRKKHPKRASLKDKLRYLLTRQQGLALWESGGGRRLGGFAAWREQQKPMVRFGRYQQLLDNPRAVVAAALPRENIAHLSPADLLAALFNWVGCPIELDDLVHVVAELWGIRDEPELVASPNEEQRDGLYESIADPHADVATEVEHRAYLQQLWVEIRQLPPRQRAALLLNLKDAEGCGVAALLPMLGIATPTEIAVVLAMPAERFATLWNDLPIDDAAIAVHLGVTRQQVINFRKGARERLARRMRAVDPAT
jgi:hypothetical protein